MVKRMAQNQTAAIRNYKRFQLAASPPNPKLRKRVHPFQRKNSVLKAIEGCRGIWSELADRLGCGIYIIQRTLRQEGWESVLEAFEQEKLMVGDKCVKRMIDIALYSTSDNASLEACSRVAPVFNPDFQPASKVVVEGGNKPIQHQHQHQMVVFQIPAEIMQKSIEDRMNVLEAVEAKEMEVNGNSNS